MALSRPLLLALLGAVLLGATFFAVQNARDKASETSATTADNQSPPAGTPLQPTELSPERALKAAFSGEGLKSASFDGKLAVSARGQSASVNLDGAFEMGARTEVPEIEVDAQVQARGAKVEGGFVSLGDKAYFTQGGMAYRVRQHVWDRVVAARKEAGGQPSSQPLPLPLPVHPRSWLRDLKSSDGGKIDGVETTRVSATVDAGAAMHDLGKLATASGPLEGGLPTQLRENVEKAVKRAEFDVYVGSEDKVLRRLTADLELSMPGQGRATVELDFDLTSVNKPQTIDAPAHVERGAPSGPVGEFADGFLTGLTAALGRESSARRDAASAHNPQKLQRAVREHRKVVLFFGNPRGLDDRAVAAAVRSVDRTTKAVVLTDRVQNVKRYDSLVEDLAVSQAPAVVVIDRRGDARLVEGYVDVESLAQVVADAR
jgi:hypothetical protein